MKVKHMQVIQDESYPEHYMFRYEYKVTPNTICCVKVPNGDPVMCRSIAYPGAFACLFNNELDGNCGCVFSQQNESGRWECTYYNPPCSNRYPFVIFRSVTDDMEEL